MQTPKVLPRLEYGQVAQPVYWLDLFTPETWDEVAGIDYETSGYRANREAHAKKVRRGDFLLCYLTGKSRFVGILEVRSESFWDERPIWKSDVFPVRFKTSRVCIVPQDRGIHLHDVAAQSAKARSWAGYVRGSPQRLPQTDGDFIVASLKRIEQETGGIEDESTVAIEVGGDEGAMPRPSTDDQSATDHDRIQYRLLALGRALGLDLWVASDNRGRSYGGERFGDMAVAELPIRFDDTTRKTIEHIDVLWLAQNRIEAAFEIESTTSIYSGLLRMADLLAMQPNIEIPLFIVAPDGRRKQVFKGNQEASIRESADPAIESLWIHRLRPTGERAKNAGRPREIPKAGFRQGADREGQLTGPRTSKPLRDIGRGR